MDRDRAAEPGTIVVPTMTAGALLVSSSAVVTVVSETDSDGANVVEGWS